MDDEYERIKEEVYNFGFDEENFRKILNNGYRNGFRQILDNIRNDEGENILFYAITRFDFTSDFDVSDDEFKAYIKDIKTIIDRGINLYDRNRSGDDIIEYFFSYSENGDIKGKIKVLSTIIFKSTNPVKLRNFKIGNPDNNYGIDILFKLLQEGYDDKDALLFIKLLVDNYRALGINIRGTDDVGDNLLTFIVSYVIKNYFDISLEEEININDYEPYKLFEKIICKLMREGLSPTDRGEEGLTMYELFSENFSEEELGYIKFYTDPLYCHEYDDTDDEDGEDNDESDDTISEYETDTDDETQYEDLDEVRRALVFSSSPSSPPPQSQPSLSLQPVITPTQGQTQTQPLTHTQPQEQATTLRVGINITKTVEFFDPIMQETENILIADYIKEDIDNVVFIYNTNDYFFTKRSTIVSMEKQATLYPCDQATGFIPPENVNSNMPLFNFKLIGFLNGYYGDIKEFFQNNQSQLFAIIDTNITHPSFVSYNVLHEGGQWVSGLHCQEGQDSRVTVLKVAYPSIEDNTKPLQIGGKKKNTKNTVKAKKHKKTIKKIKKHNTTKSKNKKQKKTIKKYRK